MVLMRMGDDDAAQIGEVLLDEARVGQDQVDARSAASGKVTPTSTTIHSRALGGP